jgi:hypothetical protein
MNGSAPRNQLSAPVASVSTLPGSDNWQGITTKSYGAAVFGSAGKEGM